MNLKEANQVMNDIWQLTKKYAGIHSDAEWNCYVDEGNELFAKYKGTSAELLFRNMYFALTSTLEGK